MFEKVNPQHPDKVADRIAGAVVDLAYTKAKSTTAPAMRSATLSGCCGFNFSNIVILGFIFFYP